MTLLLLATALSCSDEMGDFIVGNETVDRRRERRDAKMALEQGLSTEAVQVRGHWAPGGLGAHGVLLSAMMPACGLAM